MSFSRILQTALRGILDSKLRAALTALGVMIGVASVISTLALGNGARAAVEDSFRFLGSDQIQIMTQMGLVDGEFTEIGENLSYDDGLALLDEAPLVDMVDMQVSRSTKLRWNRNSVELGVNGVTADALKSLLEQAQPVDWPEDEIVPVSALLASGRFFTPSEVLQSASVVVLGEQTASDLFAGLDPIGQTVWVNRRPYTVIGVLVELESIDPQQRMYSAPNETAVIPISAAIRDLFDEEPDITITAHISDPARMEEARDQINEVLRTRHGISADAEGEYTDDFSLLSKRDLLGAQQDAARTFSVLLTAMAAVSLSVGGIGIMNVMLVSVSERTREIGVRLAIGARKRDILAQFLVEAVLLSAASGLAGIVLGILSIPLAASFNQGIALLAPESIPLSIGVALVTGICFGIYPAMRAARLDPIDALRYE
jgi:putative ABC transport system permease protein